MSRLPRGKPITWIVRMAVAYRAGNAVALPRLIALSKDAKATEKTLITLRFIFLPKSDPGLKLLERAYAKGGLCAFGITLPRYAGQQRRVAFNGHVISQAEISDPGGQWVAEYQVRLASRWFIY